MRTQTEIGTILVILGVIMILLSFFLWKLGAGQEQAYERRYRGEYEIRMETAPLSMEAVDHILEQKRDARIKDGSVVGSRDAGGNVFTAWTQRSGARVRLPDRQDERTASAIVMAGENTPRFTLYSNNGCVVSEALAYALWGTEDAEDESLILNGKELQVERIEPGEKEWILVRAQSWVDERELEFDVLTIIPEESGLSNSPDAFLSRYGLDADLTISSGGLLDGIYTLRRLPYWAAVLPFFLMLLRRGNQLRKQSNLVKALLLYGSAVGILFLCHAWIGWPFILPEILIPTRWSDFSFWERTMEAIATQWDLFTNMEVYLPNQNFKTGGIQMFMGSLGGAALLATGYFMVRFGLNRLKEGDT